MADLLDKIFVEGSIAYEKWVDMGDGSHARQVAAVGTVGGGAGSAAQDYDTTGTAIPNGLPTTITHNSDGSINTFTKTSGGDSWVKTLSYTSGLLTGDSGWVAQ